jgi:hypothetical protein
MKIGLTSKNTYLPIPSVPLFVFRLLLSNPTYGIHLVSEPGFGFTFGHLHQCRMLRLQELLSRSSHNPVQLHHWPSASSAARLALSPASYSHYRKKDFLQPLIYAGYIKNGCRSAGL